MSKSTQKKIGAFAVAAAIGVAVVASMPAQARSTPLSPEQQIERFGNKWAPAFAAGSEKHMSQPAQQMIDCKGPGGQIRNCTPLSSAYRKSFKDARVQDIAIKYGQAGVNFGSAGVKFSNGKAVELHFQGAAAGRAEFNASITMIGGKAGRRFFK
jgi:hypothetical protein